MNGKDLLALSDEDILTHLTCTRVELSKIRMGIDVIFKAEIARMYKPKKKAPSTERIIVKPKPPVWDTTSEAPSLGVATPVENIPRAYPPPPLLLNKAPEVKKEPAPPPYQPPATIKSDPKPADETVIETVTLHLIDVSDLAIQVYRVKADGEENVFSFRHANGEIMTVPPKSVVYEIGTFVFLFFWLVIVLPVDLQSQISTIN